MALVIALAASTSAGQALADPGAQPRLSARVEAGPFFRRFIRTPVSGAQVLAGFGGQSDAVAVYGVLGASFGQTAFGLRYRQIQSSALVELRAAPFLRLGPSIDVAWVFIERRTTSVYMHDLGLGLGLFAALEPYTWGAHGDGALFFSGKLAASVFLRRDGGPQPVQWGPELGAGVRF
jgi:hypothetical protein